MALVNQSYASPLEAVSGATLLGSSDFISFAKATYLSRRKPDKNLPALKQLAERVSIQTICAEVEAAFAGQSRLARSIQMYLCQKYARMKLKDIGAYYGVGQSGTPRPLHGLFFDVCAGMALVDKPFGEAPAPSEKSFVLR